MIRSRAYFVSVVEDLESDNTKCGWEFKEFRDAINDAIKKLDKKKNAKIDLPLILVNLNLLFTFFPKIFLL